MVSWQLEKKLHIRAPIDVSPVSNVVAGVLGSEIHVVDLDTGNTLQKIPASNDDILGIAFSPDGTVIATLSRTIGKLVVGLHQTGHLGRGLLGQTLMGGATGRSTERTREGLGGDALRRG